MSLGTVELAEGGVRGPITLEIHPRGVPIFSVSLQLWRRKSSPLAVEGISPRAASPPAATT